MNRSFNTSSQLPHMRIHYQDTFEILKTALHVKLYNLVPVSCQRAWENLTHEDLGRAPARFAEQYPMWGTPAMRPAYAAMASFHQLHWNSSPHGLQHCRCSAEYGSSWVKHTQSQCCKTLKRVQRQLGPMIITDLIYSRLREICCDSSLLFSDPKFNHKGMQALHHKHLLRSEFHTLTRELG